MNEWKWEKSEMNFKLALICFFSLLFLFLLSLWLIDWFLLVLSNETNHQLILSFHQIIYLICLIWLFELIDGNRIKMIINWFVCLFVSSLVGWWWWIKSHHLTHTFTHSLTLTWLCWLIWLVIVIVEISLKWLISLISNFIIDSLIDLIKSFDIDWTKSDEIDVHFDCLFFSFDVSFIWIHWID